MNPPGVVAIDGPAGSGKSTLARRLAETLGLPYVNTGLMYRAVTLEALRRTLDLDDGPRLAKLAEELTFDLGSSGRPRSLLVEGEAPEESLTGPDVDAAVSRVARHPEVRVVLRREQRRLGEGGAVMEGRDIGSVVFTDALVKILLQADPSERARRRVVERGGSGRPRSREIAESLAARDAKDATVNPLVPSADAVVIDTSGRSADEVFDRALEVVRRVLGGAR